MTSSKKLLLIASAAFIALQSDSMWLRRPLMIALAKRQVKVMPAVRIATRTQSVPTKSIVRYIQPRRSFTFKPNRLFNTPRAITFKRLVGTSAALGALSATALCEGSKAKAEKPLAQYQAPFEESRKKFYKDLESKPWAEVSKKYIKALQEEEQKLWEEFFEITWLTKEGWEAILNRSDIKEGYKKNADKEVSQSENRYSEIPASLRAEFEKAAKLCSIDPKEIQFLEYGKYMNMSASQSHITIASEIISAYDPQKYPHYQWIPKSQIKLLMLHELQHVLHNDGYICTVMSWFSIDKTRKDYDKAKQDYENFQTKYAKFIERRGDMLAALVDPQNASARPYSFEMLVPRYLNMLVSLDIASLSFPRHPSISERAAYLTQLHKEMLAATAK